MQNSYGDVQGPVLTGAKFIIGCIYTKSLFLFINNQRQEEAFHRSYIHAIFTSPQEPCASRQIVWLEMMYTEAFTVKALTAFGKGEIEAADGCRYSSIYSSVRCSQERIFLLKLHPW